MYRNEAILNLASSINREPVLDAKGDFYGCLV
jgi:hypothetical protein